MSKYFLFLTLFIFGFQAMAQQTKLLRFPAIFNDQVVFTYAGDLYTVDAKGGVARKLTDDADGFEMFARFSPDGTQIAFTGQYDGNTEVFLIPAEGGVPKRLTTTATLSRDDISDRMGPNNIVMTWRNADEIVYRSRKQSFNSFKGQLFQVSPEGGLSEEIPLADGGWCSFSPDGNRMAFNRVFREFRTWKYYRGGMADDIWLHDFQTGETTNLTNNDAQDIFPMWVGDVVYFLSDRDRTMNLFAYNLTTNQTTKLTHYTDYDIKFPSLGNQSIIFERGGELYNFDLQSRQAEKIVVEIHNDFANSRDGWVDASKFIDSWAIAPDGSRAVFGARGDVFTVPMKGITRNLTESSGVHDRNVEWSPDGKWISYISDRTGADEIYIQNQNGKEEAIQLTDNSDTYKYNPVWSPDSKYLLWGDKMGRLQFIDRASKKITPVAENDDWEIRDYAWSPDSKWLAFTDPQVNGVNKIVIYQMEDGSLQPATDDWYNAGSPCWSPDGKYLYFVSARSFNPIYSWTEWNHAFEDMNKIYMITLKQDTDSPYAPENDEVNTETSETGDESPAKDQSKPAVSIDFDGIAQRVFELPVKAGNFGSLSATKDGLYFIEFVDGKSKLMFHKVGAEKTTPIGDFNGFIISADQKKMILYKDKNYSIVDLPKAEVKWDESMDLSNMKVWVNKKEEWQQIYEESWRQMRDFFYDPGMHGQDWPAIKEKYEVLLPYVNDRNDLNYLIGEMIGELNVGHAYVNGGDKPEPERMKTGLLGAKLSKDPSSGYFKIEEILKGENWQDKTRSPLTEVGVDVSEGDYIIAVDGTSTADMSDIYAALVGKAGKTVQISVNEEASENGAHDELIKPIADESGLYYYNWVHNNIKKVHDATNGQIGYIHIPDMGPGGLVEFVKYFYPQLNKKGLIIDDRGNGGGNVSPMIIERLKRELALYGMSRNNGVRTKPAQMMPGPKVMLIDRYSASDGDLFPYQFKKYNMGTIVGTRSWGGVVGIRGSLPFIDGGDLRKPEFAPFDEEGNWVIEGYGVDPDIVIDNDPAKEYAGEDAQLNKAIEVIMEQLSDYPPMPEVPETFPDKTNE